MKLPTLYSRRSDGKTQIVELEVDGNQFRTHSGILDGKIVISSWTVCAGKNIGKSNETSPEQQALAEAQAKWTKKKSEKYSETIEVMDAERVYSPMLAKTLEDYEKELFDAEGNTKVDISASEKLDGIRCVATKGALNSRNGKPFVGCPHIIKALEPLFEKYPDLILDGELYTSEYKDDFNSIVSSVKKSKPTTEDFELAKKIQYHVYDIPSLGDKSFSERFLDLANMYANMPVTGGYIQLVWPKPVKTRTELTEAYLKFIEDGYEGAMVRLQNSKYENKRSKSLLKMKEFKDAEFTILDIVEGSGNRSGVAGYMCFMNGTKTFKSNIKGDREFLQELLLNKDFYVGKTATVKYFGITPDNSLRFPCVVKVARETVE